MSCDHRAHLCKALRGHLSRICDGCGGRVAVCAFCDHCELTGEHIRAWRYFGLSRKVEPRTFPIDFFDLRRPDHATCWWLCCPACLDESGEPAMMRYINGPLSMLPEPSYTRVMNYRGELLEERP